MLINFLWIASLWLGIGLISGLAIWFGMAISRRVKSREAPAVRPVPAPRAPEPSTSFRVLTGGGGPKPMGIAGKAVDRSEVEAHLISVPGGHR